MADETSASGGGAPSAYEVNDSDFEVSDVEGDMTEKKGQPRGNNTNGSKIVNGKSIPLWKKGANLGDLMNMAHRSTKMSVDQGKNKVENTTKVNTSNKNVSSPISCNYSIDYTVVVQNGKMVVKYIGAHTRKLRSVWVPKMAYTNLQGPKQVWVPKS